MKIEAQVLAWKSEGTGFATLKIQSSVTTDEVLLVMPSGKTYAIKGDDLQRAVEACLLGDGEV